MALTKAEQDTYIGDVHRLVAKVQHINPDPPEPIEGDRFVVLEPAHLIRARLRREAKRERLTRKLLDAAFYIGGVAAALTVSALFIIHLVKP